MMRDNKVRATKGSKIRAVRDNNARTLGDLEERITTNQSQGAGSM